MLLLVAAAFAGYFLMRNRAMPQEIERQPEEQAVEETIEFVSILDKIHPDEIHVLSTERAEWSNSCLGLPMQGETCEEALVTGWKITLEADGIKVFRTDKEGMRIRRDLAAEDKSV